MKIEAVIFDFGGVILDLDFAVRTGFYRANLTLLTTPASPDTRDETLRQRLTDGPPSAHIVYVTLQCTAEEVAERLAAACVPAQSMQSRSASAPARPHGARRPGLLPEPGMSARTTT